MRSIFRCCLVVLWLMPLSAFAVQGVNSSVQKQGVLKIEGCAGTPQPFYPADIFLIDSVGRKLKTEANEAGCFEFTYQIQDLDAVVEVRAEGKGAKGGFDLASYLGDVSLMLEMSGGDGVLSVKDSSGLRVNPHNSGIYVAMKGMSDYDYQGRKLSFKEKAASLRMDYALDVIAPFIQRLINIEYTLPDNSLIEMAMNGDNIKSFYRNYMESGYCSNLDFEKLSFYCKLRYQTGVDHNQVRYFDIGSGVGFYRYYPDNFGRYTRVYSEKFDEGSRSSFLGKDVSYEKITEGGVIKYRVKKVDGSEFDSWEASSYNSDCNCWKPVVVYTDYYDVKFILWLDKLYLSSAGNYRSVDKESGSVVKSREPYEIVSFSPVIESKSRYLNFEDSLVGDYLLAMCENQSCEYSGNVIDPDLYVNYDIPSIYYEWHQFKSNGTGYYGVERKNFSWLIDGDGFLSLVYEDGFKSTHALVVKGEREANTLMFYDGAENQAVPSVFVERNRFYGFSGKEVYKIGRFYQSWSCPSTFSFNYGQCLDQPFGFFFLSEDKGSMLNPRSGEFEWKLHDDGHLSIIRRSSDGSVRQVRNWTIVSETPSGIHVLENISKFQPQTSDLPVAKTNRLIYYSTPDRTSLNSLNFNK